MIVAAGDFSVTVSVLVCIMVMGGGEPPVCGAAAAPPSTGTTEYGERCWRCCGAALMKETKDWKVARRLKDIGDRMFA